MNKETFPGMLPNGGHFLIDSLPHAQSIGMKVLEMARAKATVMVPYAEHLIGDPETGVIHGGVVTSLLDNASGLAAFLAFDEPKSIATLDLRIDYNRPAQPGRDLIATTYCHKVTRSVAFIRGTAYDESIDDPVATSVAVFMITAHTRAMQGETK